MQVRTSLTVVPGLRPSSRRPTVAVSRWEPWGASRPTLRAPRGPPGSCLSSGGLLRIRSLTSPVSARRGPAAVADSPEAPPPAESPPRSYASRWGGGDSTRPCLRPPPAPSHGGRRRVGPWDRPRPRSPGARLVDPHPVLAGRVPGPIPASRAASPAQCWPRQNRDREGGIGTCCAVSPAMLAVAGPKPKVSSGAGKLLRVCRQNARRFCAGPCRPSWRLHAGLGGQVPSCRTWRLHAGLGEQALWRPPMGASSREVFIATYRAG